MKNEARLDEVYTTNNNELYVTSGDRLRHFLDVIGFGTGRGAIQLFHDLLVVGRPDIFSETPYTTIRAWFRSNSPPLHKMDIIVDIINENREIGYDHHAVKLWWKTGKSEYPFTDQYKTRAIKLDVYKQKRRSRFIIEGLIHKLCGDAIDSVPTDRLISASDTALRYASLVADPDVTECPEDILISIIKTELGLKA